MTTATRARVALAITAPVLWGCGGDAADPADSAEIATPAAPGAEQPYLEAAGDGVWMSWTEPAPGGHRVAVSYFDGAWSAPGTIAEGDAFFVNWADFPSVRAFDDRLYAHWLWRGGQGTYDYGVRVAWSDDRGATWSEPWTPHDDGTPTEHGFVSFFGDADGVWAAWLDGRAMVEDGGTMSLRARQLPASGLAGAGAAGGGAAGGDPPGAAQDGDDALGIAKSAAAPPGPETVVDGMTCECCQTDATVVDGVPVVVYRDRAEGEIRDIHVSRLEESGWAAGGAVHDDGWVFGGCPVNGPAMAARGADVAVAWFAAPDNRSQVKVAFSGDGAVTFGPPVRLDAGRPIGRVDVVMLDDGSALVTWIEAGDAGTAIVGRRAARDGVLGETVTLAATDVARASGFPRIARLGADRLMLAWTDPAGEGRVRASVFDLALWNMAR